MHKNHKNAHKNLVQSARRVSPLKYSTFCILKVDTIPKFLDPLHNKAVDWIGDEANRCTRSPASPTGAGADAGRQHQPDVGGAQDALARSPALPGSGGLRGPKSRGLDTRPRTLLWQRTRKVGGGVHGARLRELAQCRNA